MDVKKQGFTIEEHVVIGQTLHALRDYLLELNCQISNAFPKTSSTAKKANGAVHALDSLRSSLDNIVCGMPGGGPRIYYPGDFPSP